MYICLRPDYERIFKYFPFFPEVFEQIPTLTTDWVKVESKLYINIQKIIEKHSLIDYSHDLSFIINLFRFLNYVKKETAFNQKALMHDNYARDLQRLFDSLDSVSKSPMPFNIKFDNTKWKTNDQNLKDEILNLIWDNPLRNRRWKIAFDYLMQLKLNGEIGKLMKKRTGGDPNYIQGSIRQATTILYQFIYDIYPAQKVKRQIQILIGELFSCSGLISYDRERLDNEADFYEDTISNWTETKIPDPFPPQFVILLMDQNLNSFFSE